MQKDLYGKALLDYFNGNYSEDIKVLSPTMEDDYLPLPYLFRAYQEMPAWEQKALNLCKGKILDVGAGAGAHSLWLKQQNFEVSVLDKSEGAIKIAQQNGFTNTYCSTLLAHQKKYDTILLLMNGTGIFEELNKVDQYLLHLKSLLNKNGQILIDSSDIKFLFEDDDGGLWLDASKNYYGEVTFSLKYKGEESPAFNWLYMDFELLKNCAIKNELNCELILKGDNFEYLARITPV